MKEIITALDKPAVYPDLKKPSDFQKLNEVEHFFAKRQSSCLVFVEIQSCPELFSLIWASVDYHGMRFVSFSQ